MIDKIIELKNKLEEICEDASLENSTLAHDLLVNQNTYEILTTMYMKHDTYETNYDFSGIRIMVNELVPNLYGDFYNAKHKFIKRVPLFKLKE